MNSRHMIEDMYLQQRPMSQSKYHDLDEPIMTHPGPKDLDKNANCVVRGPMSQTTQLT